jgi:hypothetical protein
LLECFLFNKVRQGFIIKFLLILIKQGSEGMKKWKRISSHFNYVRIGSHDKVRRRKVVRDKEKKQRSQVLHWYVTSRVQPGYYTIFVWVLVLKNIVPVGSIQCLSTNIA